MFSIVLMIRKGRKESIEDCFAWTSEVNVFHSKEWDLKAVYAHWTGYVKSFRYKEQVVLVATRNGKEMWVAREKVSHISSDKRLKTIHSEVGEFDFYATLKDLSDNLEMLGFVRINKSLLVSVDHVEKVENDIVKMKNGDTFKISRKYVKLKLFYLN